METNKKVKEIVINTNNDSKIWVYVKRGNGKITFSGNSVLVDSKFTDTEINDGAMTNETLPFSISESQILFRLSDIREPKNIKKVERLFDELKINIGTKEDRIERLEEILVDNGYNIETLFDTTRTWIIAPKFNKLLVGKKNIINVDFKAPDYEKHYTLDELKGIDTMREIEVYSTSMDKKGIKDITYTMHMPDDLYYALQKISDISKRPTHKVIESNLLSSVVKYLNIHIDNMLGFLQMETEEKKYKKVILISYLSNKNKMRDEYNFGYIGEHIGVGFRYYIAYMKDGQESLWHRTEFNKLFVKQKYATTEITDGKCRIGMDSTKKRNEVIITWSQEREDFLENLHNSFSKLKDNLDNFIGQLDESKLDNLIENKTQLKLN